MKLTPYEKTNIEETFTYPSIVLMHDRGIFI